MSTGRTVAAFRAVAWERRTVTRMDSNDRTPACELMGTIDFGAGYLRGGAMFRAEVLDKSVRVAPMHVRIRGAVLVDGTPQSDETLEIKFHIAAEAPISYWARATGPLEDGGITLDASFDVPVTSDGPHHIDVYLAGAFLLRHTVHP